MRARKAASKEVLNGNADVYVAICVFTGKTASPHKDKILIYVSEYGKLNRKLSELPIVAMGEMLGITPKSEKDSVDFLDESIDDSELKRKMIEYAYSFVCCREVQIIVDNGYVLRYNFR